MGCAAAVTGAAGAGAAGADAAAADPAVACWSAAAAGDDILSTGVALQVSAGSKSWISSCLLESKGKNRSPRQRRLWIKNHTAPLPCGLFMS